MVRRKSHGIVGSAAEGRAPHTAGQVFVRRLGGVWETDDSDPAGEVNIAVRLPDGSLVWPVQRAMKRLRNGAEDGLYVYGRFAKERSAQ